jgi:hypothetical protein
MIVKNMERRATVRIALDTVGTQDALAGKVAAKIISLNAVKHTY